MALGSSAPEIILNVIEIIGSGFVAGDLGPGKISKTPSKSFIGFIFY